MSCIYCLEFPNGKRYIGKHQNDDPDFRIRGHFYVARSGGGSAVHAAIRKYGQENISVHVLANNIEDEELAFLVEREAIDYFKSFGALGYNLTEGGEGVSGVVRSEKWKNEQSERIAECWTRKEFREAVSEASRKRWQSQEFRDNHSRAVKENWKNPEKRTKLQASKNKYSMMRRASIEVRKAYGECLYSGRQFSPVSLESKK